MLVRDKDKKMYIFLLILTLFENSLLVLDFFIKFSKAFEKEFSLSMPFFVSIGLRFIPFSLSSPQM